MLLVVYESNARLVVLLCWFVMCLLLVMGVCMRDRVSVCLRIRMLLYMFICRVCVGLVASLFSHIHVYLVSLLYT